MVKFVQTNFLAGRSFYDDTELDQELNNWLNQVNQQRPSAATEQLPAVLLTQEQQRFGPLPAVAADYGFFDSLTVSRESLVMIETNRYSVPVQYVGQVVTARIYQERIELFAAAERIASHVRHKGRRERVVEPAHFEPVLARKPRGRVMLYRDWLVAQAPSIADYVSVICRKRRDEMGPQILGLYELAQTLGLADFRSALELAAEGALYGVEYVTAIATPTQAVAAQRTAQLQPQPQGNYTVVERNLASYEDYVANWLELRATALEASREQ